MGGNAFNHVGYESKRMTKQEFETAEFEVHKILHDLGIEAYSIPYVREKESFGDIDIVVVKEYDRSVKEIICENASLFQIENDNQVFRNGDVISVLYQGKFQVDFIFTTQDIKFYHREYLSHNDLGNLIGRIIKESGFQHGHNGLFYVYREGNHYKELIELTTDYSKALEILGLDVEKFYDGFDTFTEMFEYVTSSKYFKKSRFALENLNNRNRVRDKKRKVYNEFLKYIETIPDGDKTVPSPFEVFPWLEDRVNAIKQSRVKINHQKERFNGKKVHEWTGLSGADGKKFGQFLEFVQNQEDFEEIVLNGPEENIEEYVTNLYNRFNR